MSSQIFPRLKSVPPIARIVITQATRRRAEGAITDAVFEEQIRRIIREELQPKRLTMLVRELPGGRRRFIIKEEGNGAVCDLLDFAADGSLERVADEPLTVSAQTQVSS